MSAASLALVEMSDLLMLYMILTYNHTSNCNMLFSLDDLTLISYSVSSLI